MQEVKLSTVHLSGEDLAAYLDVTAQALSRAVRRDYNAAGYRVSEWADWHHGGKRVQGYDVPRPVAREIIPVDEWEANGLSQSTNGRARNPRALPTVDDTTEARAHHAAKILRSLRDMEELRDFDLDTLADRLDALDA